VDQPLPKKRSFRKFDSVVENDTSVVIITAAISAATLVVFIAVLKKVNVLLEG
jgi:hypothetical protein